MAEPVLRRVRQEDAPALAALWRRCFGDGESLTGPFFRLLPQLGGGVTAEAEGRCVGAAYALTGLELLAPGRPPQRWGYLYAVAVDVPWRRRGLGRALTLAAAELAGELGAERICTLPAERSLYPWYEDILGLKCALFRRFLLLPAQSAVPARPLEAEEYLARRETLLAAVPHLRPSPAYLRFQKALCRSDGGDLYEAEGALAAAYPEAGRLVIRELLCPPGACRSQAAGALAGALGLPEALLCESARPDGEPYLAAPSGSLPPDCVWGLTLD